MIRTGVTDVWYFDGDELVVGTVHGIRLGNVLVSSINISEYTQNTVLVFVGGEWHALADVQVVTDSRLYIFA